MSTVLFSEEREDEEARKVISMSSPMLTAAGCAAGYAPEIIVSFCELARTDGYSSPISSYLSALQISLSGDSSLCCVMPEPSTFLSYITHVSLAISTGISNTPIYAFTPKEPLRVTSCTPNSFAGSRRRLMLSLAPPSTPAATRSLMPIPANIVISKKAPRSR